MGDVVLMHREVTRMHVQVRGSLAIGDMIKNRLRKPYSISILLRGPWQSNLMHLVLCGVACAKQRQSGWSSSTVQG